MASYYTPHPPDSEGLQPAYNLRAGDGIEAPEPAYNLRAGDGMEAPQVLFDHTQYKTGNAPPMENRWSHTALVKDAKSPHGFRQSSSYYSSFGGSSNLRPDSDPRSNGYAGEKQPGWNRRPWYRRRRAIVVMILTALIIIAAAITVPLMILRSKSSGSSPQASTTTGDLAPLTQSTSGALARSAIGANDFGDPTIVYFQHFEGDLWETASGGQDFVGKILDAGSMRNDTPLAAISYLNSDQHFYRHVIYLDKNSVLHDILEIEGSGNWNQGFLGSARLRASNSPTVGLSFIGLQTEDKSNRTFPMGSFRVYFGGADGRIHEATLAGGDNQWRETYIFPEQANGNGGIYVGQPWFDSNLICTSTSNELIWFHQDARDVQQTPWSAGQGSGIDVVPGSGVGMSLDYIVYYQDADHDVHAIEFNPNNTDTSPWSVVHFIGPAIPNTRLVGMSVDWDATPSVVYQKDSDGLTQTYGTRGRGVEIWTNQTAMPVDI